MRAVIICGGDIGNYERAKACIKPGDMIICADSGYAHAKKMNIRPDVVLGDFDSYKKDDVICDDIKIYPAKKDFTDSEIAADYALKNGADEILLLASTGGRIDHTLANIYLLKTISQRGIFISIFDGESTTYYLNNLNNEFLLLLFINIVSACIAIGSYSKSIKYIEEHILRLEEKQDKHNSLIERMVAVEQSVKSAHHRLDNLEIKKRDAI